MNYRRLGDSGIKLSEIGLGGWLTFGNAVDVGGTRAVFDQAFESGINFFDTANVYASGKCEEVWGEVLHKRRRDSFVLATKVFFPMGEGPNDRGLSRKHIFEQCHASLKRLKTEYIDLYQCHRYEIAGMVEATLLEETVRAMDDLIRQGKVLYWGFSEWPVEKVEECLQICGDRFEKPKSSQPRYNVIQREWEKKLFPLCAKSGIGQVVFSPLAQGVLSGKYKPGAALPKDSRAADERQNHFIKGMVKDELLLGRVQKLEPIAKEIGCTMAQLALAWILSHSEITSCIVGATKPEQLKQTAAASGIQLGEDVVRRMNEIFA